MQSTFRVLVVLLISSLALSMAGMAGCDPDDTGSEVVAIPAAPDPNERTLGEILLRESEDRAAREQRVLDDATAVGVLLNDFWTRELASDYALSFDAPDRFEYYRGEEPTTCGEEAPASANNAFYCSDDRDEHVAFDLDWFQGYLVKHPRDATTFLILAHEWGHAVQDTWIEGGGGDTWVPPYRQELNADCLAGVFLAASIREGTIIEDAEDGEAIFEWLSEAGSPWLDPGSHGTSAERQTAFRIGTETDTDYCRREY